MVAASRQSQWQPAKGEEFELGFGTSRRDRSDRRQREFDRRADRARAVPHQKTGGSRVVDVNERSRYKRPAGAGGQGGDVVDLHQPAIGAQLFDGAAFPHRGGRRQR